MNFDFTNPANIKFGKNILIATSVGTAFIAPIDYDNLIVSDVPIEIYDQYEISLEHEWEKRLTINEIDVSKINNLKKMYTIQEFSKLIVDEMQDLDEEILDVLNENFWDLI